MIIAAPQMFGSKRPTSPEAGQGPPATKARPSRGPSEAAAPAAANLGCTAKARPAPPPTPIYASTDRPPLAPTAPPQPVAVKAIPPHLRPAAPMQEPTPPGPMLPPHQPGNSCSDMDDFDIPCLGMDRCRLHIWQERQDALPPHDLFAEVIKRTMGHIEVCPVEEQDAVCPSVAPGATEPVPGVPVPEPNGSPLAPSAPSAAIVIPDDELPQPSTPPGLIADTWENQVTSPGGRPCGRVCEEEGCHNFCWRTRQGHRTCVCTPCYARRQENKGKGKGKRDRGWGGWVWYAW